MGAERGEPWEPVWQGDNEPEAAIVAGRLEADGIPARIRGGKLFSPWMPVGGPWGTWTVFAPTPEAALARELLHRHHAGAGVIDPGRGAATSDQVATLKFAVLAVLAATIFGLLMAIRAQM